MDTSPRRPRKGRTWEKHPDDPGREPYRIVDLYDLRDRLIIAHGDEKPIHEGKLLFRATFFRPGHDRPNSKLKLGRSCWGLSAEAALSFCLRKCRGFQDWPADQYLALPYAEWLDLLQLPVLPDDALPDLPDMRRAAKPAEEQPKQPVDPYAPTDPAPPRFPDDEPTKRIRTPPAPKPNNGPQMRGQRAKKAQLALVF